MAELRMEKMVSVYHPSSIENFRYWSVFSFAHSLQAVFDSELLLYL